MRPTLSGPKLVTTYAVCPDCTSRQEFEGKPETLMCVRCRRAAKVDWSTTY
jgi:tRNA(Ile2) C34 agmatinyltransferase TiaS